jgi:putative restriction endonuclease
MAAASGITVTITDSTTAIDLLEHIDDAVEQALVEADSLDATTTRQLVLARKGQGWYRQRVSELEPVCRLTRLENPKLLVASHIKPWRICSTARERLDGANGLLLAPHVDRLFDRGLISFTDEGDVIVSPHLDAIDLRRLGLEEACLRNCGGFNSAQAKYLDFHRRYVLLA